MPSAPACRRASNASRAIIAIRTRPLIQQPPRGDLELEKSAGPVHNVLLLLLATRVPHKIGKERKMVGADVRPYPAAATSPAGSRQDMVDSDTDKTPADLWPFGITETQTSVGKRVTVASPTPAINAAIGGYVEIAGKDRRFRQSADPTFGIL